ncbi:hypothetical protein [Salipaludibacillus sp. CF4.18]|uniref:hypothetical protein n=1 Tax=Salipaludibacillus sp. CF4.18 TaxID=3373081 RepID=UPI003EE6D03B
MTKILLIFLLYFAAMSSLLVCLDLVVGMPLNVSVDTVLTPFEVTAPGELVILIVLVIIAVAVPIKHYYVAFMKKGRDETNKN